MIRRPRGDAEATVSVAQAPSLPTVDSKGDPDSSDESPRPFLPAAGGEPSGAGGGGGGGAPPPLFSALSLFMAELAFLARPWSTASPGASGPFEIGCVGAAAGAPSAGASAPPPPLSFFSLFMAELAFLAR